MTRNGLVPPQGCSLLVNELSAKGSNPEPKNPISTCTSILSHRGFSACRDFACRLPPSDSVARVLAVADVLSAADFYSVLQLRPSDGGNRDLARRQYAKLALLLDPTSPDKVPFSDEALARVQEARHVLSHPERRALYDRELQQRRRRFGPRAPTAGDSSSTRRGTRIARCCARLAGKRSREWR
ncbi:molecular chaperone [Spatholobus suberectus]|nr:molecular chaperone [Spatholobus suberectus]